MSTTVVTLNDILPAVAEKLGDFMHVYKQTTDFLKLVREGEATWDGEKWYIPLEVYRPGGFAFGDASGTVDLPSPAAPTIDRVHIPAAYAWQALEISFPLKLTLARSDTAIDYVVDRTNTAMKALLIQVENAMLSREGAFATIGAVSGATTLTLTGILQDDVVKMYVSPGDVLDIWEGTTSQTVTVTAVNPDANQITVTPAVTTSGTAYVAFHNVLYDNSGTLTSRGFYGLDGIVDDDNPSFRSDFESVDSSTETWWRAVVNDNGGTLRDISLSLVDTTIDSVVAQVDATEDNPLIGFMNQGVRRAYVNLLRSENTPTESYVSSAGWAGLSYVYNGRKIVLVDSWKAPKNTIYFFNHRTLKFYRLGGPDFMDEGGVRRFFTGDKPTFRAFLYMFGNLGTPNRNALAKLADINEA